MNESMNKFLRATRELEKDSAVLLQMTKWRRMDIRGEVQKLKTISRSPVSLKPRRRDGESGWRLIETAGLVHGRFLIESMFATKPPHSEDAFPKEEKVSGCGSDRCEPSTRWRDRTGIRRHAGADSPD